MKKTSFTRFLSVLLSVIMLSTVVFSTNAVAVVSASDFEIVDTVLDSTYLPSFDVKEITGFKEGVDVENMRNLDFCVLAESYNQEYSAIGNEAFKDNAYIENVVLWNKQGYNPVSVNMLRIGESAFENCTALKSVESLSCYRREYIGGINDLVGEIGSKAFKGCTSLSEFVVPFNVNYIANETFAGCTALKRVLIHKYTDYIEDDAFNGCDNLTIYGVKNTAAHSYALEHNIPFVEIPNNDDAVIGELYYKINGMCYLLNEYYYDYPYLENPEFEYYVFQDKWGAELRECFNKAIALYENVFSTKNELEAAITEAENAIHRVNVIEEIYRLCDPSYMPQETYAHCNACMRGCSLLCDSGYGYGLSYIRGGFTAESYNYYQNCKDYAYYAAESGTATTESLESLMINLQNSIMGLEFLADEDLGKYVNHVQNSDLSIYTDDTANKLKSIVDNAKTAVGTSYMYDSDFGFVSEITSIGMAMSELQLKSLDTLFEKMEYYRNMFYDDYYKYTDDSIRELSNELYMAEGLLNGYDANIVNIPYGEEGELSLRPLEMYNDDVLAQIEKLDQLYENLELLPLGDFDHNNRRDVSDVIYLLSYVVAPYELREEDIYFADLSGDGNVTVLDAVLLQREILEIG